MRSKSFLTIIFLFLLTHLFAQTKGKFDFEEETFDFGKITENNGPVEHKFVFTNIGDAPLIIQGVRASCGCTTPAWSKDPIPPGERGFVMAKYNPKNRPGSFRKSLTITSNGEPASKVIYIKGMVETQPRTAADVYRRKIGNTRFKYLTMNMGKVTTEKPLTRSFDVYNEGEEAITFLENADLPKHLIVSFQPNMLESKTAGKMIITFDAKLKGEFGYVSDPVILRTDETADAEKTLRVMATIEEYFPPMTAEELAEAPKLSFEQKTFDFGSIKKNTKASTEFIFTNTGKSDLNIRALKPNCGCTVSKLEKYDYAPGESGTLHVDFDSTGRKGSQQKSIVVFSNDPSAPTQRLVIKARVQDIS